MGNSLSFGYVIQTIGLKILQRIKLAAGPADFEHIYFLCVANSEMHSQIVLGKITATAADFVDLLVRLGFAGNMRNTTNAGADAAAVGFCADGSNLDPIIFERRIATQKLRKVIDAIHHDIDVAIVVEIAESGAARGRRRRDSRAGVERNILETAVAQIAIEKFALGITRFGGELLDLRIDMAIAN